MPKDVKDSKELQDMKTPKAAKPAPGARPPQEKKVDESFKIIRIAESDISGNRRIKHALTSIRGVSWSFSNAILKSLNMENKLVGELTDEEINKIKDALANPLKYGIPSWICNRRKDIISGRDMHLLSSDLVFAKKMDVEFLKKIKTYKGVRHIYNYKVRGQRTRSRGANVRGRVGSAVGVIKKKLAPQKKEESEK
jgi:small subunit ribosomal protein S13